MEQSYKEKYEQAIERLKQWDREHPCAGYVLSDRDKFIFPELAESEDEKVRKWCISHFKECINVIKDNDEYKEYLSNKVLAWLERQGQVKESTISQHEIETCEENGNSLTYEDERIRKEIINYFRCQSEEEPTRKEIHNKWIAWLENVPVTIDHEKREGFHLGYKAGLERQGEQKFEMKTAEESLGIDSDTYNKIVDECIFGEQKPEENKGNIGGISSNSAWSEEDSFRTETLISVIKSGGSIRPELRNEFVNWLKSLKERKGGKV